LLDLADRLPGDRRRVVLNVAVGDLERPGRSDPLCGLHRCRDAVPGVARIAVAAGMAQLEREEFGTLPDGRPVRRYRLRNASGLEVSVLTWGGVVQSIRVPDRHGRIEDVALGFDTLAEYLERGRYFGAVIGRFANRIAG